MSNFLNKMLGLIFLSVFVSSTPGLMAAEYDKTIHGSSSYWYGVCPNITQVVVRIYNKLIEANRLQSFVTSAPQMNINVNCVRLSTKTQGTGVFGKSTIEVAPFDISLAQSDDEIAYVIAHEITHVIKFHSGISSEEKKRDELEADQNAVHLVVKAGYNPNAGPNLIYKVNESRKVFHRISGFVVKDLDIPEYGTTENRVSRMKDEIARLNLPSNKPFITSPDLILAKKEFSELKKRLNF
ncbi:MAG: hypothetical protein JNL11_06110 [Bdellovibrionaceae bacterium]|nr:hypothetical protein [Pseudobdellovibrionaceae bacterium]